MPDPTTPPNGTYTSNVTDGLSSWSGSFTYTDGAIVYTRTNPPGTYRANNTSQGNAIVFAISDGTKTVHFAGPTYKALPNNKAQYSGTADDHQPNDTDGGWTATQT